MDFFAQTYIELTVFKLFLKNIRTIARGKHNRYNSITK